MTSLNVYLFGTPRIKQNEIAIPLSRRKGMALLAYLAVTQQPQGREALATILWPEADQSSALANLRRELSRLKQDLGAGIIAADRKQAAIDPQIELWLDVALFREHLAVVRDHGHFPEEPCSECLEALQEAVSLQTGDFMAGFNLPDCPAYDDWQFFEREDLREALAEALQKLMRWHTLRGEYERAIPHARRWLALDPLHEPAHRELMQLYEWAGQHSAALRQYDEAVRIIEEELGFPPETGTTELHERIKKKQHTPPGGMPSRDQEEVVRAHLPPFLEETGTAEYEKPVFVARERELDQLHTCLERALAGECLVFFVSGDAGQGKTALLGEFSRRALESNPDLLVAWGSCSAFAGIGDPYHPFRDVFGMLTGDIEGRLVAGAITHEHARRLWENMLSTTQVLQDFGVDLLGVLIPKRGLQKRLKLALPGGDRRLKQFLPLFDRTYSDQGDLKQSFLFEQCTNVLRNLAEQRPLLLLLDDLQWADSSSTGLLFHLGRRLEGARILIGGAYRPEEIALGPLADSDGKDRHPLEKVINELKRYQGEIVLDLSQSTESENQDFVKAFLDSEPNELGSSFRKALYEHTGGHPLFTVELLRAMQERGQLNRNEAGKWQVRESLNWDHFPARVEAVIEERLSRLDKGEYQILETACVEGESFTAQVVSQVQGIEERQLLRQLSQELVGTHNLLRERDVVDLGKTMLDRFQFRHALFQHYLYEQINPGELRLLHRDVGEALESLYGDNVESIAGQLAQHFLKAGIPKKAYNYFRLAGESAARQYANSEAIGFFRQALENASKIDDEETTLEQILINKNLGDVYVHIGQYDKALSHYNAVGELLAKKPEFPDWNLHNAELCRKTAVVYERKSEYDQAFDWVEKGLKLLDQNVPTIEMARIYLVGAGVYHRQGKNNEALLWCGKGLSAVEKISTRAGRQVMGQIYYLLGFIYQRLGDLNNAVNYCLKSVKIFQDLGDIFGEGRAYNNLGIALSDQGNWDQACEALQKSLDISEKIGNIQSIGFVANNLADIHFYHGEWEQAIGLYLQSNNIWKQLGALLQDAVTLSNLANVYIKIGNWPEVIKLLSRSESIFAKIGSEDFLAELERRWGKYYLKTGDLDQAITHVHHSLELATAQETPLEKGLSFRVLGEVHLVRNELEAAKEAFQKSLQVLREVGSEFEVARTVTSLTRLALEKGEGESLREELVSAIQTFERLGAKADFDQAIELQEALESG